MARNSKALQALFVFIFFLFSTMVVMTAMAVETDLKVISTDQLKDMLDKKKNFVLIDARTKEEYQEAHIPGAISIPEKNFEDSGALLPTDKNHQLVFYCNGVKCGKSKKAAKKAEAMGYTNILIYGEGFPIWEEKGLKITAGPDYAKKIETKKLTPADIKKLIEAKANDYVLVDVRDEAEFKEGHIPTAINIPVETFASRSEILPKEKKIIVYCNTGGRSYNAYRKLMKLTYLTIYQTLFSEWKEAAFSIEKGGSVK
jgi:rhodanese-related sulfurtransferase